MYIKVSGTVGKATRALYLGKEYLIIGLFGDPLDLHVYSPTNILQSINKMSATKMRLHTAYYRSLDFLTQIFISLYFSSFSDEFYDQ